MNSNAYEVMLHEIDFSIFQNAPVIRELSVVVFPMRRG